MIFRQSSIRFAALFFAVVTSSVAQTSRGTVTGIVTDASGAAVVNATALLKNTATGVTRDTTSNASGVYRFDAVDSGPYTVNLKSAGFRTAQSDTFSVTANQLSSIDIKLEVGETTSTVEVSAEATVLQTESPVRGGNIEPKRITELPFAGRNPVSLVLTLPGVSSNRYGNGVGTFSVNGSRGRSNNFLIDGTENNDISVAGQAFQFKNPDAVQEVSAQTSNFDAEFGRAGGAVINTITKGGTNRIHGTVSYLLDVTNDDAITNTQALDPRVMLRGKPNPGTDQWYSGTLGGPIVRNRTFFFGSYFEERQNSSGSANFTVLSQAGRATLGSLFPTGTNKNVDLYRQVVGNTVATSQFFNVALGNGRPDLQFGTGVVGYAAPYRDRSPTIRIDHKISDNDQLSGRFLLDDVAIGTASVSFNGFNTSQKNRYQNALLSETHIFSPAMTNELRLGYNRITLDFPVDSTNALGRTLPNYAISGVAGFGIATNLPQGRIANNYTLQDTVTLVRGKHSIRTGFDLLKQRSRQFAPIIERGALTYQASTGFTAFANYVDDFGGSGGSAARDFGSPAYYPELFRQAYFVQDRWRVNSELTLTLGVRYENFGNPVNSLRTPAYTGLFNVDPVTLKGPFDQPNKVSNDNNNFAPSIGIAYAPAYQDGPLAWMFGNKKSVIRAGYNIGYDSFFNNIASNASTSSPNLVATSFPSTVTTALPRGTIGLSSQLPLVARALLPSDSQSLVDKNLVNPYNQHWSFGIQREVKGNIVIDTSYVGSKGTKLFAQEDFNPLVPLSMRIIPAVVSPGYVLQGRLDPIQGARTIRTNNGSSYYHAAQVNASRRFASGLVFNAAYTWSKLIDYNSDVFTTNNTVASSAVPNIFGGLRAEKGLSLYHRAQRAVFTYVYELPFFREQKGLLGRALGGFQISGVTTLESGVPYTVINGVDADGIAGANDRPDFNPFGEKNVRAVPSSSSPTGYVNPDLPGSPAINPSTAQFIGLPANIGRTGNLGRNTSFTPGLNSTDANVQKTFRVTERVGLQFRSELYNIFNHHQYGTGSVSPFSPGGGTLAGNVTSSASTRFLSKYYLDAGGRVIRYQLKLIF